MEEIPLNEELTWAKGEDIEWSKKVAEKYTFHMNQHSSVSLLKWKANVLKFASPQDINLLKKII